jgi:electron transport complex protein RnfC
MPVAAGTLLTIPVSMNIGAPAKAVVKVNDLVKVGQLIAEPGGFVSSPIYSGVSGKVKKLDEVLLFHGATCQAIVIEADGEQAVYEGIEAPTVTDLPSFIDAVKQSGVVGLGGAGFPTAVKLNVDPAKVDYICINGAECEPYITVDNRTMIDATNHVVRGVKIIEEYIPGPQQIIIAIENNKPVAIKKMTEAFANDPKVKVVALPSEYPQGAEKMLVYTLTGRIIPDGQLPSDVGCVMFNVTSVAFFVDYLENGRPYTWRQVTVDGSAVKSPKNVYVPVGASLRDVLTYCDTNFEDLGKVIYGGPMMGITAYDLDAPIYKNTNAILALNVKDSMPKKQYPCIHCGKCIAHCPMGLNPTAFVKAMKIDGKDERAKMLMDESLLSCIECGSCSYVCPSRRPLIENHRLAKQDLHATLAEKKD